MRRILFFAAAMALVAAACSGGDDSSDAEAAVLPFSQVQVGELVFENDPTFPDRGIFRVTTTEPMICSITWGTTEAMGNQNNSLDMNGTGIIDHNVLLPGAEPGETYFFRVQGSTADGRLYQSDIGTFALPRLEAADLVVPDEEGERGPNLALGAAVVAVSSEFSASWAGANAIDGDLSTEWATSGDADEAFIEIDLGSPQTVGAVEFVTRSMADGSSLTEAYTIQVDGGDEYGPFPARTPSATGTVDVSFTGQLLRFSVMESTGGNTGAVEIRVYGP
jgi:hypothetical protein